jgi:hypothetical protein
MQLRRLRNTVGHTRTPNTAPRNRARNQQHPALSISIKHRHRGGRQSFHAQDVRPPAAVPFGVGEGVEVGEVREARPACVGDDDVEAAQSFGGGLDERGDFRG